MPFLTKPILIPLAALAGCLSALAGTRVAAAGAATPMAPFTVEAEFGIDGLRIQNSSSLMSRYQLEQHGVTQMQDVAGIAPNLFSSNSDTRGFGDILALRGSANSIFFSPPSVALYIDDVPGGSVSSYPSALLNIESFNVKAGPQGTSYGRNAPAGAIDIRTRAPGGRHQGRLLADAGSFNALAVQAAFDGPLGAKAGYSAGFAHAQRDGYVQNTFLDRTADDRSSVAGRGTLVLRPEESLQLRFGVMFESARDDATRLTSLFSPNPFEVASDLNGITRIDRRQFSFQARKKFTAGNLILTTSRQEWDLDPSETDLDLSPMPAARSRVVQSESMWTQEVRFESLPAAGKAQWRTGLFLLDSDTEGDALRQFMVPPGGFVPPGFVQTEQTTFAVGQRSLAAYAGTEWPVSSQSTVELGLRFEHAKSELDRDKASSNNFGFPSAPDPTLRLAQDSRRASLSTGLVHELSDSVSLRVRSSLANRPSGYSGFTAVPALARFDSERTWANEVGITFGPPQARFGSSLLVFWNRIDGYQFERTVPGSTDFVVVNADEVISRGIEAKCMWNPIDRVWWEFQTGYTDAAFRSHRDANGVSVNGRQVPFVPRLTLRTGLSADFGRGWSGNASYAVVGLTHFDERNTGAFAQRSYGIVNAQLQYRVGSWSATLYGRNLTDQFYYQFINPEIFAGSPGAPRQLGVQLAFEY